MPWKECSTVSEREQFVRLVQAQGVHVAATCRPPVPSRPFCIGTGASSLPRRILGDNGSPWGADGDHPFTPLTVWLLQLGVNISHGRPHSPADPGQG